MKKLLPLFALATLSPAQATTSLQEYMQGSGGKLRVEDGIVVVNKRTRDLKYLPLGVAAMGQTSQGRLNRVGVFAFKDRLSAAEVELLATNVTRIASKCFNINPERGNAVAAWLTRENKTLLRNTTRSFGPLNATFVRSVTKDGNFFTAVHLQRSGQPGAAPWVNYCVK